MAQTLLIDAYSLAFRAFFAIPADMASEGGQPTNALFGFCRMLSSLVEKYEPDRLLVAFDAHAKTFRDDIYSDYKGHRPEIPTALRSQLPLLRELMDSLNIPWLEIPGFEADDVIASAATVATRAGDSVKIVTGDRDSFQLVRDPDIQVLYNKRGVSEVDVMDEAAVVAKVGVAPLLYPHLASLRGDPSDNIIGVSGVGEKTAAKLVNEYGSVGEILRHIDSLPPKLASSLEQARDRVENNLTLSLLVRDIPLERDVESFTIGAWDSSSAREFMFALGLRGSYDRIKVAFKSRIDLSSTDDDKGSSIALADLELVPYSPAIKFSGDDLYVGGAWVDDRRSDTAELLVVAEIEKIEGFKATVLAGEYLTKDVMAGLFDSKAIIGINTKPLFRSLLAIGLGRLPRLESDLSIAEYLIDPSSGRYSASDLKEQWIGAESVPEPRRGLFDEVSTEVMIDSAVMEVRLAATILEAMEAKIVDAGMERLYREIELPLVLVLAKMEHFGIGVDLPKLQELSDWISSQTRVLYAEMQEMIGRSFNPNSTQQLAQILFTDLGLKPLKKTKTGFSTDAQTLERLRDDHPFVATLLKYREFEKLRSTYGESLISEVGQDGRIHATFQQTVARTGRLSSDHPNMHNIPIRSEEGRRFRDVFVAPPGSKLVVADYSQIELRIIAHLSGDKGLLEAFRNHQDVHTQTAAMVFAVEPGEVTYEQRSTAKMVAYGLAYGMEAYGLAQRLGISNKDAEAILNSFFTALPDVRSYMDRTIAEAKRQGYTTTEFGRRRYIPELASPDQRVRQAAERQAMNAGIQGLAADIFKVALVRLDAALETVPDIRIVLQVHDEIVLEAADESVELARQLIVESMTGAAQLEVPLLVNVAVAQNWGMAKS